MAVDTVTSTLDRLHVVEAENAKLRNQVKQLQPALQRAALLQPGSQSAAASDTASTASSLAGRNGSNHDLTKEQIARYSRQLLLPSFGPQGVLSYLCVGFSLVSFWQG